MDVDKIENIEDLFPLEEGQKIIEQKIKRLTAPGENYGSLMLSVDVKVQTPDGVEEINAVGKMVPPSEFIQELFNTQVTYRNEIGFYKHIVPALQNFQKEHGVQEVIDFTPKYYGSRLNLRNDDNGNVDSDAALILENLKSKNYVLLDRIEGFDLDVTKLVLTDLAYLHAVPIALKLQKKEVFKKEIQPYLDSWRMIEKAFEEMRRDTYKMIDNIEELAPYIEKVHDNYDTFNYVIPPPREPFATVIHNDCWVNNTMQLLENGKPIKNKLVDYQICDYGSPAKDVIFFLFSSVNTEILKQHCDSLIRFYHNKFISILSELKCDTTQFSWEAFGKELDYEAKNTQFGHILFMLYHILLPESGVREITEFQPGALMSVEPSQKYKEKIIYFITEFAKRNWL